jgi:hypothetical protein
MKARKVVDTTPQMGMCRENVQAHSGDPCSIDVYHSTPYISVLHGGGRGKGAPIPHC